MTHFVRKHKTMREVDLIPMINVIFMLLFFFIIAGTVKPTEAIPIDIPNAETSSEVRGNPVILSLSRGGKLLFDGAETTTKNLPRTLTRALDKDPNILITIRADERLPAHSLIKLIGIVHESGGVNLALEVEKM